MTMADLPLVPDCEGPRLHPYNRKGTDEIEFIDEVGHGAHAHVFKVRIDGKIYALKVFLNQLVTADWVTPRPDEWDNIDNELLTAQWHPFNAECRAYARLKEARKEHLAVRCHGYTLLTDAQEKELADRFGIQSWWDEDYDIEPSDPQYDQGRRRAIVKDFVQSDQPFGHKDAPRMIRDLKQLHRLGIVVHDLNEDAYVGGKLTDFSKAITVPHIMFDVPLGRDLDYIGRSEVHGDLSLLGGRFDDWNEDHEDDPQILCRPLPNIRFQERLRQGRKTERDIILSCLNPRDINWRKFSARPSKQARTRSGGPVEKAITKTASNVASKNGQRRKNSRSKTKRK